MFYLKIPLLFSLWLLFLVPVQAQELHEDLEEIIKVEITEVVDEYERDIHGIDTTIPVQLLHGQILSGDRKGEVIEFENELVALKAGDRAYINYMKTMDGMEYYIFKDYVRTWPLLTLSVLFVALLAWFAGRQGWLALLSLGLSIGVIFFILVPMLLAGYDPAMASLLVAGLVLAAILFITHGVNARTTIAFIGTFAAVLVTCLIAWIWVNLLKLTGFGSETAVYLNFSTNGELDFVGLLLGGIIIGVLGVLDDVSITQASIVQELKAANSSFDMKELYNRSIRVGRDHVGSLVNTLAFAYVGVSLPLVLLFVNAQADLALTLNQEVVAAEIVRIVVGSIGLILAVPLTTIFAAWWFSGHEVAEDKKLVKTACGHAHH